MEERSSILYKFFRKKNIEDISVKLKLLGDDVKYDTLEFSTKRLITTILIFIISLHLGSGYIFAPLIAIGYYYLYYYIFITKKINKRIKELDYDALEFFEILTLTLESGRNLEQSLRVTCETVDSKLSDEFKKVLMEMEFGKSLIEALESMKKRIPSETINNIILDITQTNQFGNSIIDTMYNQVDYLREKQILEIRGQINKIPNKVSIISVIFIVPLILVLILGPYLIKIIS